MNTSGVVSLDYVVMNLKNRMRDYTMDSYSHYMQLIIDGLTQLNIFSLDRIEVAYLQMDGKNAVSLPPDFVDYTKVGIIVCGQLWTLTLNDKLIVNKAEVCGIPLDKIAAGCCEKDPLNYPYPVGGYSLAPHFHNGEFIDTYFGIGGGFNSGYYKIDKQDRLLIVQGVPKSTIVLEYRSTGIKPGGGTLIPRQAVDCLIAWVMWKNAEFGIVKADPNYWKNEFLENEYMLRNLDYTYTADEYLDTFYSSWHQGPKR